MAFDPTQEYGNAVSSAGFASGKEYIEALIEDAKKTLPPNTEFQFISWTDDMGKRLTGWVFNLKTNRLRQKVFNPLKVALST